MGIQDSMDLPSTSRVLRAGTSGFAGGHDARDIARKCRRALANAGLVILLMSLVVDGFPAGIAVLREFGARPTNFLLLAVLGVALGRSLLQWDVAFLRRRDVLVAVLILVGVPAINLPVALLQSSEAGGAVITAWGLQYLMFAWGICSFLVWKRLLAGIESARLSRLVCWSAMLPVAIFLLDYLDVLGPVAPALDLVRFKRDIRPSSLATEPSLFAAWIVVVWPFMLLVARTAASRSLRVVATGLLLLTAVSAFLTNARTAAAIVVLQLGYFGYSHLRRSRSLTARLRALFVVAVLLLVTVAILAQRLLSLANVEDNASNIARLGYTVTGINVMLAHPFAGIGIGQFTNFFATFVPDFALASDEVALYASGQAEFRASTFNLFVRLLCEFGIPLGLFLSLIVVQPLRRAARYVGPGHFYHYAALSAVGGVGFWLTQDQYGYQPAIFSLALLAATLAKSRGTPQSSSA